MTPSVSSAAMSSADRPSSARTSWLCWPSNGAGERMHGPRPAGQPERHRGEPGRRVDRVVQHFEESARGELFELGLPMRLHHLGHRDARRPQGRDDLVAAALPAPRAEVFVDDDPRGRAGQSRWPARDRPPSPDCRVRRAATAIARRWPPRSRPRSRHGRTRRSRLSGRDSAATRPVPGCLLAPKPRRRRCIRRPARRRC